MNQAACDMEGEKPKEPKNDENRCDAEYHGLGRPFCPLEFPAPPST
jgi:hypothetical protein